MGGLLLSMVDILFMYPFAIVDLLPGHQRDVDLRLIMINLFPCHWLFSS